jgi:hypothetical protein
MLNGKPCIVLHAFCNIEMLEMVLLVMSNGGSPEKNSDPTTK